MNITEVINNGQAPLRQRTASKEHRAKAALFSIGEEESIDDALVVVAALNVGGTELCSEDLHHAKELELYGSIIRFAEKVTAIRVTALGHFQSLKRQEDRVTNDRSQGAADVARCPCAVTKSPKQPLKDL